MKNNAIMAAILCSCFAALGISNIASAQAPTGTGNSKPSEIVVFIPGFIGTKLLDVQGHPVWGNIWRTVTRFGELELTSHPSPLVPGDILDEVTFLGPFKLGQYSGLLKSLEDLGYKRGKDLFVFPYDWRQSNFDTANKLDSFIEEIIKENPQKKVTIIAHSMGGLVARIYIKNTEGRRVNKLITMGTPFYGAAEALHMLFAGLGSDWQNSLVGGKNRAIQVLSSFPSTYELLPTYGNHCAYKYYFTTQVNVTDIELWERCKWLPPDPNRAALVRKSLERAKVLRQIIDEDPLPGGVQSYKIVGDAIMSFFKLYINDDCKVDRWVHIRGDGTVPLYSATMEKADRPEIIPAIHQHSTIFNDPAVINKLRLTITRDETFETVSSTEVRGIVTQKDGTKVYIKYVAIDNKTPFVKPGGQVTISIQVTDTNDKLISNIAVEGHLNAGKGSHTPLAIRETNGEYLATIMMPTVPGAYIVTLNVPGLPAFEDYVAVLEN